MSTYQPPGGQPEGTPGYAPPQDPWAGGYEPGLASVPTDPIPQAHDPYAAYPQADVWSQPTAVQGGYGYVAQPQKSRAGMYALLFLVVVLLGGGGGYAAWYVIKEARSGGTTPSGSVTPSATPTGGPVAFDPYVVKEGDCLANKGTQASPAIELSACSVPGSYKVVRIVAGIDIQENEQGVFDDKVTSVAACKDTNYQTWYGYQDTADDAKDLFFCMTNN